MSLQPTPEFNWAQVSWGGPKQRRTEVCSYCDQPLGEEDIPLMLWNEAGWCAEFCEVCQEKYWGAIMCDGADDDDDPDAPKLGPCCICQTEIGVRTVIMLPWRNLVPGHGWGCVTCGLPPDGASAVLCDDCTAKYAADEAALAYVCRGYPPTDGRVPFAEQPRDEFRHEDIPHG